MAAISCIFFFDSFDTSAILQRYYTWCTENIIHLRFGTTLEQMFLKGKKKFGKLLSKMGVTRGAGSIERMDVLSQCSACSDSEISSLNLSVTSNESENLYKIHVSIDDGGEAFFMVSDVKELSDITKKVLDRYPEQNQEDVIIKYYGKFFTEFMKRESK